MFASWLQIRKSCTRVNLSRHQIGGLCLQIGLATFSRSLQAAYFRKAVRPIAMAVDLIRGKIHEGRPQSLLRLPCDRHNYHHFMAKYTTQWSLQWLELSEFQSNRDREAPQFRKKSPPFNTDQELATTTEVCLKARRRPSGDRRLKEANQGRDSIASCLLFTIFDVVVVVLSDNNNCCCFASDMNQCRPVVLFPWGRSTQRMDSKWD